MTDVTFMKDSLLYRRGSGILIFRSGPHGPELLVGKRTGFCPASWQPPQGGLHKGLTYHKNALMEAREEVGLKAHELVYLGLTPTRTSYRLDKLSDRGFWGQEHRWAVFKFASEASLTELLARATDKEFSELRWTPPMWVTTTTAGFRRAALETAIPEGEAIYRAAA